MKYLSVVFGIVLGIGLLTGCSKQAAQENKPPRVLTLGTVELTANEPSRHDAGEGETCVIKASPMGAASLELVISLEKGGKQISSSRVAPAQSGVPVNMSLADVQVQLTPRMK
jgi:PBP1b-binding outer membrane lipoprotein LpoB